MSRFFHILPPVLFSLITISGAAWSATALWLNTDGAMRTFALALLVALTLGALRVQFHKRRLGWALLAITALAVLGWYQTITPRADRHWAPDVAHGVTARVSGDQVTLSNLRDFEWQDRATATQAWVSQTYDLTQLDSVDMFTSVWGNPDIAHLLVSFGFADGEQVAFSVEIRREADEVFSELGGFFRQFELVLIGAKERDIVKLRADHRGEDVRMFPVDLSPEHRRQMFMSYVALAHDLEAEPQFYNTISANCTTVVYGLARNLQSDLPIDSSLILSGRLPQYLENLGVLGGEGSLQDRYDAALLPAGAEALHPGLSYSQAIRAGR
jgi:hypothetical protein